MKPKELTIGEAKNLKHKLESDIYNLIIGFEEATSTQVADVRGVSK